VEIKVPPNVKKTITIILIGFIIGITCTIGVGSYIFDKSGWRETIKHSKEAEKQLRIGIEGIATIAGIEDSDGKTIRELTELIQREYENHNRLKERVDDLERIDQDKRAIITSLESELRYQDNAFSRLGEIVIGSTDLYTDLANFLENIGL